MRIGIDARVLYAPQIKGVGRYLQYLLNHLSEMNGGHEYVLFYDPRIASADRTPRSHRVKAIPITARAEEIWEQWALPNAVRRAGLDLFHSPANTTMLWPPCPTVITLHDTMSHQAARGWGRWENFYWNSVQRWAYRSVRCHVTPTQFSRQQIIDELRLPQERIVVVYHGIGQTYHPVSQSEILRWKESYNVQSPYVFVAGARLARKNIPTALRAFDLIAKQMGQIQLVVSGVSGVPEIETLVAQLSSRARIRLLPHLDEPDLVVAYSGAELFVFPSLRETFGFPPLEAMACGVPVIASNATCIPEVVGDGAYLVDCAQSQPLAQAMIKVLEDSTLRAALINRGLARAKQFRWERAAEQTLGVYKKAVQS